MASASPPYSWAIDSLRQKIRDGEARAAWHRAFHQPNAEQEARGLVLALRHDLETLLDCRAAAARSILALRKPGIPSAKRICSIKPGWRLGLLRDFSMFSDDA